MIQNIIQFCFVVFWFCKDPRCCFINIFICSWNQCPNISQSYVEFKFIHCFMEMTDCFFNHFFQTCIKFSRNSSCFDFSVIIFVNHWNGTIQQIPQIIGQIKINTSNKVFWSENSILSKRNRTHQIITNCIKAITFNQHLRINNISFWFRHFSVFHQEPSMSENLFRSR